MASQSGLRVISSWAVDADGGVRVVAGDQGAAVRAEGHFHGPASVVTGGHGGPRRAGGGVPQAHSVPTARDGEGLPVRGEGHLVQPGGTVREGASDDSSGRLPQLYRTVGAANRVCPAVRAENHHSALASTVMGGPGAAGGHLPHPHPPVVHRRDGTSIRAEGDRPRVREAGETALLAAGGDVPHPYSTCGGDGHSTTVRAEDHPAYRPVGDGEASEFPTNDRIQQGYHNVGATDGSDSEGASVGAERRGLAALVAGERDRVPQPLRADPRSAPSRLRSGRRGCGHPC